MKQNKVYDAANKMINIMESMYRKNENRALLSDFRNSAGKPFSRAENIWPFMFENLPGEFLGKGVGATYEENAIYAALQLYAICRQGSSVNIIVDSKNAGNIGDSFSVMRGKDSKAVDRRFNALTMCSTFDELYYHLRQLIKLLMGEVTKPVAIDFARLAEDLFWYQMGKGKEICFSWAKEYYRNHASKEA